MKKEAEEGDEPRAETESESEEELSCFAPTVRTKKLKCLKRVYATWPLPLFSINQSGIDW